MHLINYSWKKLEITQFIDAVFPTLIKDTLSSLACHYW